MIIDDLIEVCILKRAPASAGISCEYLVELLQAPSYKPS